MKNCDHGNKVPKDMTVEESEQLFSYMLSGTLNDVEMGEILLALKEKGETAEEIIGAIRAIKKTAELPAPIAEALDVCGTGGDGLHTLNISTAVGFVVAGAGVKVAKHGNKAVSSSSGSSDVLSTLGLKLDKDPLASLQSAGFGYFHAPLFYPALKTVAPARAALKTRTIFNLLGPLLNPVGANFQLVGVYSAELLPVYAKVLRALGVKKAWVVHGKDGLDEMSISGNTFVCELAGGAIDQFTITPEDAGLKRHPLAEIKGGDANYNANAIIELLGHKKAGAYRDIVLLNAASALIVAGRVDTLEDGVRIAAESIDSGKAWEVLQKLKG